jgi:all-trans-8'-apo-beta-carotenal 15,15'-oxygenase
MVVTMSFSRRDFMTTSALLAGATTLNPFRPLFASTPDLSRLSFRANRSTSFVGRKNDLRVTGEIPYGLKGSYLKNGPGLKELFGQKFDHYFDGDALVAKFQFENGRVDFQNQFIDTPERVLEAQQQRMIYDEFGTAAPMRRLQGRKNQPNISLLHWQDELYAFSEGGHPVILDQQTLQYKKTTNFNNGLPRNVSFIAHPKIDPVTGDLYGLGIHQGITMAIKVFRVDARTKRAEELYSFPQKQVPMIHDFNITKDKIIIVIPSAAFRLVDLARGVRPLSRALKYRPQQASRVMVLGKNEKRIYPELKLPSSMLFHHGPAYEEKDQLTFHTCVAEDGKLLNTIAHWRDFPVQSLNKSFPNLKRFTFDLKSLQLIEEQTLLTNHDFPTHHSLRTGQDVKNIYAVRLGNDDDPMAFSGISKVSLESSNKSITLSAPPGVMYSEAVYVQNEIYPDQEEQGWLLFLSYDEKQDQTTLEIVNSVDLSFQARVHLDCFIPLGFHGLFRQRG